MNRARLGFLALIGGATGIGFAPVLVRMSETGPTATAFFRLLFAVPLIWIWATWDRRQHPTSRQPATRKDFLMLGMAGLLFTADLSIWHWSLQFTTVTNSTLLTNVAPIFVTIGARILFGDRIKLSFVIGMVLAIGGAAKDMNRVIGTHHNPGSKDARTCRVQHARVSHWRQERSRQRGLPGLSSVLRFHYDYPFWDVGNSATPLYGS